jgi:tetratricopeptide (TPR) repeat protein
VHAAGARANSHTAKPAYRYTQPVNQVDQFRSDWAILALFFLLLALVPCLNAASGDEHSFSVSPYAISVQQMQVSPKVRAHLEKARQEFGRLDLPAASTEVERALRIAPGCAQAFAMRAFIELASSKFDSAMTDALHATSLDPNDAISFLTLATAENSRGAFESAAAAAQKALQRQPGLWQAHLEIAKAFYGQEQFIEALRELNSFKIDFPDVHLVRANILLRIGRAPEAAQEFATFLDESPRDLRNQRIKKIVADINRTTAPQQILPTGASKP